MVLVLHKIHGFAQNPLLSKMPFLLMQEPYQGIRESPLLLLRKILQFLIICMQMRRASLEKGPLFPLYHSVQCWVLTSGILHSWIMQAENMASEETTDGDSGQCSSHRSGVCQLVTLGRQ